MRSHGRLVVIGSIVLCLSLALGWAIAPASAKDAFPLQNGDTWVMVGDSITAQHLHTNYFEAYCFTRFAKWTIHFRNSGVGGDTIPKALARFDWDAAAWKPTLVSVELGMNDSGPGLATLPAYTSGMATLTGRIRKIGARPVLLSASPVNDGTTLKTLTGRNITLDKYATALGEFAQKQGCPFADQFHALVDVWAKDKAAEGGDAIHPGPPGQLTMATALLYGLHAPTLVSKATVSATGRARDAEQCTVKNVKVNGDAISFDRLDDCLPMPIPDNARAALIVLPEIAGLSQWMLTVSGLKAGNYDVAIDDANAATVSDSDLAKGWNMSTLDKGPVAEQGRQVLAAIVEKETLVSQWRGKSAAEAKASTPEGKAALAELTKQVFEADAKIRAAAQPKTHHFAISPTAAPAAPK